ncbi:putative integrase [Orientia tsutsugamushi str. Gilliam]|uniref:Putative integrase n=1 Tax=Orientia tsutsugamushi str. Gilliam TaxID=1359184 RepID=A0A0F3M8S4_ORITS|nr:putative integrase [Orientia tsutsugamushi str. Gilliam]
MPKYILINSQKDAARIYNYRKLLFLKKKREIKRNDIEPIFNDITAKRENMGQQINF